MRSLFFAIFVAYAAEVFVTGDILRPNIREADLHHKTLTEATPTLRSLGSKREERREKKKKEKRDKKSKGSENERRYSKEEEMALNKFCDSCGDRATFSKPLLEATKEIKEITDKMAASRLNVLKHCQAWTVWFCKRKEDELKMWKRPLAYAESTGNTKVVKEIERHMNELRDTIKEYCQCDTHKDTLSDLEKDLKKAREHSLEVHAAAKDQYIECAQKCDW